MPADEPTFESQVEAKAREMCAAAGLNPDEVLATAPGSSDAAMPNWRRYRMAAVHSLTRGG